MASLVIGNRDCSYERIINAFQHTKACKLSVEQWIDVPRKLIPEEKCEEIADGIEYGDYTMYDAYRKMLEEWRKIDQNAATLDKLFIAFEQCHLTDSADVLRDVFGLPPRCPIDETEEYKINLCRLKDEIKSHINNNRGGLSRHTKITDSLKSALIERQIITQEDINNDLNEASNEQAESARMYNILLRKPENLNHLIQALEAEKQFAASWILRRFYRSIPAGRRKVKDELRHCATA